MRFNNKRKWSKDNYTPGDGITVIVRNNDVNAALRKFKKKVQEAGIIQEYRERQFYVKPSEKRRKAKQAGRKRWQKKQEKLQAERGY